MANMKWWQWWAKLSAPNKLYVTLAFFAFTFMGMWTYDSRKTIAVLRSTIKEKNRVIDLKDSVISVERQAFYVHLQQDESRERADRKKADSLLLTLMMADRAVQKAQRAMQNGK